MPEVKCTTCNRTTNTALSNFWTHGGKTWDGIVTKCYAALEGGEWVKGCAYDKCNKYENQLADRIISSNPMEKPKTKGARHV